MDTFVDQFLEPDEIKRRSRLIRAHDATIADLIGISPPGYSSVVNGKRGLSVEAQKRLIRVLGFLEGLHRESKIPPDLNNLEVIRPLWEAYRKRCDETEVLRLAEEIRSRNDHEKTGEPIAQ